MDDFSKKYFDKIASMDVNDLTKENIAYLRARIDYLSGDQKLKFAKILVEKKEEKKDK